MHTSDPRMKGSTEASACEAAPDCRNFSRRGDINSFNMINYEACENCRYFTADNICDYRSSMQYQFDMS